MTESVQPNQATGERSIGNVARNFGNSMPEKRKNKHKQVKRKSTSLDEAELRTKCVELANISTTQRRRSYREQTMLLRLDKNSI